MAELLHGTTTTTTATFLTSEAYIYSISLFFLLPPFFSGFWREFNTSNTFYRCCLGEEDCGDCVGGVVGEQCNDGKGSALCAACVNGSVPSNGDCLFCPNHTNGSYGSGGWVSGGIPTLLLFILLIIYFIRKPKGNTGTTSSATIQPVDVSNKYKKKVEMRKLTIIGKDLNKKIDLEEGGNKKIEGEVEEEGEEAATEEEEAAAAAEEEAAAAEETVLEQATDGAIGAAEDTAGEELEGMVAEASGDTMEEDIEADTDGAANIALGAAPRRFSLSRGMSMKDLTDAEHAMEELASEMYQMERKLAGRLRIIIGFLQIQSALVFSFSIPWPPMFSSLTSSFMIFHFDFMTIFSGIDPCSLYTPFLEATTFHMLFLPLVSVIVGLAMIIACHVCMRQQKLIVVSRAKSVMMELILFLYPGITTKCFTSIKCQTVGSKAYLVADFSVTCWEGSHASVFAAVLVPAMLLLVLGIPIGITLFLYKNKKILTNETDVSLKFQDTYGAAYMAYEPKFCKCCCCYFEDIFLLLLLW